jgi:carbon storage regulator
LVVVIAGKVGFTKETTPMLVLTRKRFESILIGRDIRVTIVAISGGKVRIGIEAPGQVDIVRQEILAGASQPVTTSRIEASE